MMESGSVLESATIYDVIRSVAQSQLGSALGAIDSRQSVEWNGEEVIVTTITLSEYIDLSKVDIASDALFAINEALMAHGERRRATIRWRVEGDTDEDEGDV